MVGLLWRARLGYRNGLSALPEVDYHQQVITFYPGASPDVDGLSWTAPLELNSDRFTCPGCSR